LIAVESPRAYRQSKPKPLQLIYQELSAPRSFRASRFFEIFALCERMSVLGWVESGENLTKREK
jgi:hypothetical protein